MSTNADSEVESDQYDPPLNELYIDEAPFGLEKTWDYEPGGHHPVHLGDQLGRDGQYRIIHKLGSGGFANVWLAQTIQEGVPKYHALKILMADYSKDDCAELRVNKLQNLGLESHISLPLDQFQISGPNGSHLCFVYPVAGPRVSCIAQDFEDPDKTLRKVAHQAVAVMATLHEHGICHGDFTPSNILLRVDGLDGLAEHEVFKILGEPLTVKVFTGAGETPSDPTAPQYLVRPVNFHKVPLPYITDQVLLIDFGECYEISNPPEELGIPESYRAPEIVLENKPGVGCDLWALGCTLFEIRTGRKLFSSFDENIDDLIRSMVLLLGVLPEPWWSTTWKHRKRWFEDEPDSEGRAVRSNGKPDRPHVARSIERALSLGLRYSDLGPGDEFRREISREEIELLGDLLRKILQYEPSRRLTAAEAQDHEWFRIVESISDRMHERDGRFK
ncbi:putative protein kinase [Aspergillus clavatus NRRL 1]|uniref:EKC/KEOPS complex subunit BUD32 n=1 Tax=Aspergillus clavatus (strain ATCC 1007 / CBS 513.65 / DSM 816 / NCTC 3887 / NRRL 1 / QM 1276 / 107) TaxID=344612 RepID=A1CGI4_ASPCL|nr:protein kinase, putative [Aspergillus clavatus NRRL 1]EAW11064.1 protein kinase, putative [Aspergillus clavatus NRRL 1]